MLARLRAVIEAKDTEVSVLRAELAAERELRRRMELRIAELERRLGMDSGNSGTPSSKEPIGAKERRKAEREQRDTSERERRKDRKRGGQPGHRGAGLSRDRDPDERKTADPPAECSGCGASLAGVTAAASSWAQVWDVEISRWVTEWLLPSLACPCCGKFTTASAPPGAHPGTISYGPGVNTAAVLLSGYGNVPAERTAHLIGMLLGVPVSAGFADRASARLDEKLQAAGFDNAMQAALADEPVLGADETPVNVLTRDTDPETGQEAEGAPHVLIIRPDHPSPRREADLVAGARVAPRGGDHRDLVVLHRDPDHRRVHRLPADAPGSGGHPAVRRARHPPLPCGQQARPRQLAVLGRRRDRDPAGSAPSR